MSHFAVHSPFSSDARFAPRYRDRGKSDRAQNYATITVPAAHPVDGQNLKQLLIGQSDPKHRNEFLNHCPHPRRGQSHFFTTWRTGDWKVR